MLPVIDLLPAMAMLRAAYAGIDPAAVGLHEGDSGFRGIFRFSEERVSLISLDRSEGLSKEIFYWLNFLIGGEKYTPIDVKKENLKAVFLLSKTTNNLQFLLSIFGPPNSNEQTYLLVVKEIGDSIPVYSFFMERIILSEGRTEREIRGYFERKKVDLDTNLKGEVLEYFVQKERFLKTSEYGLDIYNFFLILFEYI
jgi:hypothetical protein